MGNPDTKVSDLSTELGITRQTLYMSVSEVVCAKGLRTNARKSHARPISSRNEGCLGSLSLQG